MPSSISSNMGSLNSNLSLNTFSSLPGMNGSLSLVAGLFHSQVQFAIAVFPKPLPVSKTEVFNNFYFLTRKYRLKPLIRNG